MNQKMNEWMNEQDQQMNGQKMDHQQHNVHWVDSKLKLIRSGEKCKWKMTSTVDKINNKKMKIMEWKSDWSGIWAFNMCLYST